MSTEILSITLSSQLTPAWIQDYQETGFAVVHGVFSISEIAAISEAANQLLLLNQLIDVNNLRCRWQNHYQTDECRFD